MSMLITIISIIATAIISIFIARWQMRKNQVVHYFINSYDIGKGLTDDFPNFQLYYGNEMLSDNVKVLKGGFVNIGKKDIGDDGKTTEINLNLPKGCIVKAVKVSPFENGLIVDCPDINKVSQNVEKQKNENKMSFVIDGVFKTKEWFNYTAIIEAPKDMNSYMYRQLKLEHRIKDTKIKHLYLGPYYKNRLPLSNTMILLSILYVLLFLSLMVYTCLKPVDLYRIFAPYQGVNTYITSILFLALIIAFVYCSLILWTRWGRSGRVINILTEKHKSSDYSYMESLFIG